MKHPPRFCFALVMAVVLAVLIGTPSVAASKQRPDKGQVRPKYREGMILVKPKKGVDQEKMKALHSAHGAKLRRVDTSINWQVIDLPNDAKVEDFIEKYRKSGLVEDVVPNYILPYDLRRTPNDTLFTNGTLWGLDNLPLTYPPHVKDIDAPEAWYLRTGAPNVKVMVADTGVWYNHPDLFDNIWFNSPEDVNGSGRFEPTSYWQYGGDINGEDEDGNGTKDDVVGYNGYEYWNKWFDPDDSEGHGTLVAGVIGGVGDNGVGVTGVCWDIDIVAGRCGGEWGAETDAFIRCVDYAIRNGVKVITCSFGGSDVDAPLRDKIQYARDPNGDGDLGDGIIFVCAAGNGNEYGVPYDTDQYPHYPSSYELDNIVSVAATDRLDLLAVGYEWASNYGLNSVDLAAPGDEITSTFPYGLWGVNEYYVETGGTSLAVPYVVGALAMLQAQYPAEKYPKLIARLFAGVDQIPSTAGKCTTGGRLNLYGALTATVPDMNVTPSWGFASKGGEGGPFVPTKVYKLTNLGNASLDWTATADQNWIEFTPASGSLLPYGSVDVTVGYNSNANGLPIGSYSAVVSFTNVTTGSGNTTRPVSLTVGPVYVRADGGNDSNDGLSWATAKRTIQAGVDAAKNAGMNEVWVAQGSYERFSLDGNYNGMKVYGGFVGTETSRSARPAFPRANANTTASVIDGTGQYGELISVSNCSIATTRIDGFTLKNCSTDTIYCTSSSCTIANNTIMGGYYGAAIYLASGAPVVLNNKIRGCYNSSDGAGIYCGSTEAGTLIANNTVLGNLSMSTSSGCAGIYCTSATALIANNTIVGNKSLSEWNGGPATTAGGVWVDGGNITFVNNIVAYNSSGIHLTSGTNLAIRNCDVWGNDQYQYRRENDPSWNPTNSNGNISQDPLISDRTYGNVHIRPASRYAAGPCTDTGDDSVIQTGWVDMDGQARKYGPAVDMGADEYQGATSPVGPPVIVRVSPTGNDSNSGSSWTLAKRTIQAAIDTAAGTAGEVWVKTGTYRENTKLSPYVYVYGGFGGSESIKTQRNWATYPTIIDGQANDAVVYARPGSNWCTLNGFVLCNGSGHRWSSGQAPSYGGGICCFNAYPEFSDNTVVGNRADYGGGIYYENSLPTIVNNKIASNIAENGGGVYAQNGYGVIANNTVVSNTATYNDGYHTSAGGLDLGGADQSTVVTNNIVAFNSSGICVNTWGYEYIDFRNNCVHGNGEYEYYDPYYYDPNWQPPVESNNISTDPKLVSLGYGNLHIHWESPCKNAGDNSVVKSDWKDIDNQARVLPTGGVVDIGCDEANQVWTSWTPARYYVATDGNDANPGTGWGPTTAKRTVQAGINLATINGGEVWVKQGTYNERVTLHPYAYVYGGFAGMECYLYDRKWQLFPCILDGQASGSVVTARAGIGVSRLDGFTIRNGSGYTDLSGYNRGGGIFCQYAAPTFANNTITGNTASNGAGIACVASSPTIDSNRITGNNTSTYGQGGGIYCGDYAEPTISNNVIATNNAPRGSGGGIALYSSASPLIINNTIAGNSTKWNYYDGTGGGVYCNTGSYNDPAVVRNNIIVDNTRFGVACWDGTLTLSNNNVFNNAESDYYNITADPGSISQDPDFISGATGDYRLLYGSPCLDAGSNTGAPATDFNGCLRPYDSDANGSAVCDMGAYELGVWPAKYRAHYTYLSEVYFGPVSVVGVYPTQGWVYVEALDRIGGIRVNTSESLSVGDIVTVFGTVQYDSPAQEMYVQAYSGWPATTGQTQILDPLGMRNEWAKETSSARDISSDGSFRYYSTGSLVQTWGKVEWTYPYGNNFTIHDGSKTYLEGSGWTGAYVIVHLPPGGTMPALGDYVRVSGVITGTTQYSVNLRPRTPSDMETITTWNTSSITLQSGWNYLSIPGIPQYSNAENVFVGCAPGYIGLAGNLKRYLAPNQYWDWFGSCWNSSTGGILVGEGYGLNITGGSTTCYSYPRTDVTGDQILSLPRGSESAPFWEMSFIGNPFDTNVAWSACRVTDGYQLLTLQEAVSAGWIHKVQKQQGNTETLVDVNIGTEYMEARKGYVIYPKRDKLALIVPDPSP